MFDLANQKKTPRTRRPVTVVSRSQLPPNALRTTAPPPVITTQRGDETVALGNPYFESRPLYSLQAIDPIELVSIAPGAALAAAIFTISLIWLAVLP